MPITYDKEKRAFIALGEQLNKDIDEWNCHLRSCRERTVWGYNFETGLTSTTDLSEVEHGQFAKECDKVAKEEILQRKQDAKKPITSITFMDGQFVAVGGGPDSRQELRKLGWVYQQIGLSLSLGCSDPFIVDISDKYELLDHHARAEFDKWKSGAELRIKASSASDTTATFPAPAGMEYLPFQRAGIELCLEQGDKILGDEMGLGKTIQAIGVANAMHAKRVLVVCPASLKINWQREIDAWQTEMLPISIIDKTILEAPSGFVVVNYDILHQVHKALSVNWDLIIFDEAHYLKNEDTRRNQIAFGETIDQTKKRVNKELSSSINKSMKSVNYNLIAELLTANIGDVQTYIEKNQKFHKTLASRLISEFGKKKLQALTESEKSAGLIGIKTLFLTGTPVPNRPSELLPLLKRMDPDGMGSKAQWFLDRYCDPTWNQFSYGWEYKGACNTDELSTYLRARFLIRRLKKNVLAELPEKTRQIIEIEPGVKILKLITEELVFDKRMRVIAETLRTIDPSFHDQIKKLQVDLGQIEENMAVLRRTIGLAKVPDVVDRVKLCFEGGADKIVIMAHHHDVIDNLMHDLTEFSPVKLNGEMKAKDRQKSIDSFQTDPTCKVFVGSIQAAGVGITLTAASTVIFAELDWVPGNMLQAEDRCHRIGQHDNVFAQYLVFSGSLDAIMCKTLRKKEHAISSILGDATSAKIEQILTQPLAQVDEIVVTEVTQPKTETNKRKRGRPKVYVDIPAPSPTERSKHSVRKLKDAGGKRVMLRLTPDGLDALKTIMEITGIKGETETINQVLVIKKQDLLRKTAKT